GSPRSRQALALLVHRLRGPLDAMRSLLQLVLELRYCAARSLRDGLLRIGTNALQCLLRKLLAATIQSANALLHGGRRRFKALHGLQVAGIEPVDDGQQLHQRLLQRFRTAVHAFDAPLKSLAETLGWLLRLLLKSLLLRLQRGLLQ